MKWLKYTDKDKYYLDLGDDLVMKKDPFTKGYQLWDKAYNKRYWTPAVVNPNTYQAAKGTKVKPVEKKAPVDAKPVENKPTVEIKTEEKKAEAPAAPKITPETAKSVPADVKPAAVDPKTNTGAKDKPKKPEDIPNVKIEKRAEEKPTVKVQKPVNTEAKSGGEDVKK